MADTLSEIYNSTTLGSTQMDDGEETILTTNASTSYVVKDMNVQNTSALTGTYLELNGFNVGSVASNATGSLVIPPNSTLKIKSTNYPFSFSAKEIYFIDQDSKGYYKSTITTDNTSADPISLVEAGTDAANPMDQPSGTIAMRYVQPTGSADAFFHSAVHDNNSVQKIRYNRFGASNQDGQNAYQNYAAVGFHDVAGGGYLGIISNGDNFRSLPLSTIPTTTTLTTFGNFNNSPTSSYPRSVVFGGYVWWLRSQSYLTTMYAINIATGHGITMAGLSSESSAGSSNRSFGVSLDPTTDKFYIWRPNSNATMQVIETNDTKAVLDAKTSDYSAPTTVVTSRNNLPANLHQTYMSTTVLSPQRDGTIKYQVSGATYVCIDKNLNEVGDRASINSMTVNGTSGLSAQDKFYSESTRVGTSAEATSVGLSAPTFGLQLLGIKSEA